MMNKTEDVNNNGKINKENINKKDEDIVKPNK
jgi:hypothetical protein